MSHTQTQRTRSNPILSITVAHVYSQTLIDTTILLTILWGLSTSALTSLHNSPIYGRLITSYFTQVASYRDDHEGKENALISAETFSMEGRDSSLTTGRYLVSSVCQDISSTIPKTPMLLSSLRPLAPLQSNEPQE